MASDKEREWINRNRSTDRPRHWGKPKLTPAQRDDIRQRLTDGEPAADLAAEYGVTRRAIEDHR